MHVNRRDNLQRSLRSLAEAYSTIMQIMDQTLKLLCEEAALDPLAYMQAHFLPVNNQSGHRTLVIDPQTLLVNFQGKKCFLGNTLSFKLLSRLARRPNAYVTYEELFNDVWEGRRSDAAVRSVVKTLRHRLRRSGLASLADAIDGTVPGRYALKLDL